MKYISVSIFIWHYSPKKKLFVSTAAMTTSFENAGLSVTGKTLFTHTDLTMDIQHIFSQAAR